MRDPRINYTVVGAFVVVMLAALVVSVALLTGRTGSTDTYYAEMPNVVGLKYGSKVTYEGFVVGQVTKMEPLRQDNKTRFRLSLEVREGWAIPKDSIARIASSGILAAVVLDIKGGQSTDMLPPGGQIATGPIANMFAVMNEVAAQVSDLNQTALKPLLATLNARVDTLGKVLEQQAPELMANLIAITTDLAVKTPRITSDVEKMSQVMSSRVVTEANARNLQASLENVAELTRGLKESREKMDAVLVSLDKVVGGNRPALDAAVKDLRHTLQTLARNIDSITYNLEGTSRNMQEFSRQLRDNPGVLIGGTKRGDDGPRR